MQGFNDSIKPHLLNILINQKKASCFCIELMLGKVVCIHVVFRFGFILANCFFFFMLHLFPLMLVVSLFLPINTYPLKVSSNL